MKSYNGFSEAQRNKAQAWLNAQWAAGTLPRPGHCVACGVTKGIFDAHAEDYSEPFGAHLTQYPLCYRCHMMLHCRFGGGAETFNRYVTMLKEGHVFPPMHFRDWGGIKEMLEGKFGRTTLGPARARVPLLEDLCND